MIFTYYHTFNPTQKQMQKRRLGRRFLHLIKLCVVLQTLLLQHVGQHLVVMTTRLQTGGTRNKTPELSVEFWDTINFV